MESPTSREAPSPLFPPSLKSFSFCGHPISPPSAPNHRLEIRIPGFLFFFFPFFLHRHRHFPSFLFSPFLFFSTADRKWRRAKKDFFFLSFPLSPFPSTLSFLPLFAVICLSLSPLYPFCWVERGGGEPISRSRFKEFSFFSSLLQLFLSFPFPDAVAKLLSSLFPSAVCN